MCIFRILGIEPSNKDGTAPLLALNLWPGANRTDETQPRYRPPKKVIDLFAGVGGLSLGAARAGFSIALAVEWAIMLSLAGDTILLLDNQHDGLSAWFNQEAGKHTSISMKSRGFARWQLNHLKISRPLAHELSHALNAVYPR